MREQLHILIVPCKNHIQLHMHQRPILMHQPIIKLRNPPPNRIIKQHPSSLNRISCQHKSLHIVIKYFSNSCLDVPANHFLSEIMEGALDEINTRFVVKRVDVFSG